MTVASPASILSLRQDAGKTFQNQEEEAEPKCSLFRTRDPRACVDIFPYNNRQEDSKLLAVIIIQNCFVTEIKQSFN